MPDFRIDVGFFGHIKTKKLRRRLGFEGVFALQMLWAYAAQHEHDGCKIYTAEDIALAVDWDGDDLAQVLAEVGYLDEVEGGYSLHEWETHNGYAASASKRSEAAREAANKKWAKKTGGEPKRTRSERLRAARELGTHTQEEWQEMVSFFNRECVRCGATDSELVRDHIIPIYQGGSDGIENIQPLCRSCNASKGPENTDHRLRFCLRNACEMPADWLLSDSETPTPFPSPSPSPSPSPEPDPAPHAQDAGVRVDSTPADSKPKFAPGPAPSEYSVEFLELAEQYPRKDEGLAAAWIAFKQCKAAHAYPGNPIVLPILVQWRISPQWTDDGGRFVPNFSRWIRERRWEAGPPEDEKAKVAKQVADMMAIRDMKKAGGMRQ